MNELTILKLSTLFILIPPLILIEGLFSGAEIALFSADKLTLKKMTKQGSSGAKLALDLINHPGRIRIFVLFLFPPSSLSIF
jgi:CBS domain containing-hemolysin-like protein